jgi:hypothetical protein
MTDLELLVKHIEALTIKHRKFIVWGRTKKYAADELGHDPVMIPPHTEQVLVIDYAFLDELLGDIREKTFL